MNYKESFFFIGKCLTISHDKANKILIEKQLESGLVDWDLVTKVSTSHYVFPALYCNLKRANFLMYLPQDLVDYMINISDLNRERNLQIIEQAKEINELFLANNITPIFLKGAGNLLEGLYEDIAERMLGDIDFIFSKEEYPKAIEIITNYGYSKVRNTDFELPSFKHYPRLQKENSIAAIEVHKEIVIEKYAKEFNFTFIEKDKIFKGGIHLLSYENQFAATIIAHQINNHGQFYNVVSLRNMYDIFLLSMKINSLSFIDKFNLLFHPLNNYIALCNKTLGQVSTLKHKTTKKSLKALTINNKLLESYSFRKKNEKKWNNYLFLKIRLEIVFKSLYKNEYRVWLIKRLINGRQNLK